jgi:hypothetical protein
MKLGMSFFTGLIGFGSQRLPFVGRHGIEVGQRRQNDGALFQPRNASKQGCDCRCRSRNSCRQCKAFGRPLGPASRQSMEQPAAPIRQIDEAAISQHCRPAGEDCPQPYDRLEPVTGQFRRVCRYVVQFRSRKFLDRKLVHGSGELRREAHRLGRGLIIRAKHLREEELPFHRVDGRRYFVRKFEWIESPANPLSNVLVADRDQPW